MTKITRNNRLTLPADALREAGLQPGDNVQILAIGPGRLEVVTIDELVAEFAGIVDSSVYPPGYLDDLRRT